MLDSLRVGCSQLFQMSQSAAETLDCSMMMEAAFELQVLDLSSGFGAAG